MPVEEFATKGAIQQLLDCGVAQVNIGSLAAHNPDLFVEWMEDFGAEKMILSADAREGKIAVHGWEETTSLDLPDFPYNPLSKKAFAMPR